jgi:hypothetical protein
MVARWPELDVGRLKTREEKWLPGRVHKLTIRRQQRRTFDREKAEELERAIISLGRVHSPLQLAEYTIQSGSRQGEKHYVLIAGERRVRAVKKILKGGVTLRRIPVLIYINPSKLQIKILQALENTYDRPPILEEGEHLGRSFVEVQRVEPEFSNADFAALMGRTPDQIRDAKLFVSAPKIVRDLAASGNLSYTAAVDISRLSSDLTPEEIVAFTENLMATHPSPQKIRQKILETRRNLAETRRARRDGALSLLSDIESQLSRSEGEKIHSRSVGMSEMLKAVRQFSHFWSTVQVLRISDEVMPWTDPELAELMVRMTRLMKAELPNLREELGRRHAAEVEAVLDEFEREAEALLVAGMEGAIPAEAVAGNGHQALPALVD